MGSRFSFHFQTQDTELCSNGGEGLPRHGTILLLSTCPVYDSEKSCQGIIAIQSTECAWWSQTLHHSPVISVLQAWDDQSYPDCILSSCEMANWQRCDDVLRGVAQSES